MNQNPRISAALLELCPRFAERAPVVDAGDRFVADNFTELEAHGLMAAGVPQELGGMGASHAELCEMLRVIARSCGSTALAFSMHTHQVVIAAWRWRHQNAPVDGLLKRIASENLVLLSSGGSDWLEGSGTALRVEGGYRVTARKVFASGCPAGDLLMTSAVYDDPQAGPLVLHFGVSMKTAGVRMLDTWRALGMRGTGSNDIELADVFVPDAAIGVRRPRGKWHGLFHVIVEFAFPLIYSAYCGVAEAAHQLAVEEARRRKPNDQLADLAGGMDNELALARLALLDMIDTAATKSPGVATTARVMTGRTLVARGVLNTVTLAMELAGGAAFHRAHRLERLFRDAQAARFHPLREGAQRRYSGRVALGLDVDDVA